MKRLDWLLLLGVVSAGFAACGPDAKPGPPCGGPTYNLVLQTEDHQPLPPDTRLNVRYGGNHEGEAYALGETPSKQAVFCDEDPSQGGAPAEVTASAGAGGSGSTAEPNGEVWALRCRLYTQGPARIDVTATGYEPIEEQDLTLGDERCQVVRVVELKVLMDAGL